MKEETKLKEKVTKKVIVGTMQNYTGASTGKRWNQDDASMGYDAFVASLKGLILTYGKVVIKGLGTFDIRQKKGRRIKNNFKPQNGTEYYEIEDCQYVVFIPSPYFSDEIKELNYVFEEGEEE